MKPILREVPCFRSGANLLQPVRPKEFRELTSSRRIQVEAGARSSG